MPKASEKLKTRKSKRDKGSDDKPQAGASEAAEEFRPRLENLSIDSLIEIAMDLLKNYATMDEIDGIVSEYEGIEVADVGMPEAGMAAVPPAGGLPPLSTPGGMPPLV